MLGMGALLNVDQSWPPAREKGAVPAVTQCRGAVNAVAGGAGGRSPPYKGATLTAVVGPRGVPLQPTLARPQTFSSASAKPCPT
ncbi:MAG TPA: hypothetical protein DCR78_04090, partial [Pseudomonas sp.]|nr:hypothetical protein [Pseudomonas sp.]